MLGAEVTATGTARYVDSSLERLEVRTHGLAPERHAVTVNGIELPLLATATPGVHVAGVRYRAWCPPHARLPHPVSPALYWQRPGAPLALLVADARDPFDPPPELLVST